MIAGAGNVGIDIPIIAEYPADSNPTPTINQTSEIETILNNVTEGLMQEYIQDLQDFGTRYSYAVMKNFKAGEYIYESFSSNGLATEYDYFNANGYRMRNVVAELPGKTASDEIFIICAHYDSISNAPYEFAPGADDNGSGVAAVLAAAELLSDYEFNHTIRFIAFSGEEQGLWGSGHYASNSKSLSENISAVINLDMFGHNPDPGSTTIWAKLNANADSEDLAYYTKSIAENYTSIVQLDVTIGGTSSNSDHHYFGPEYPAIHIFEDQFSPYYHLTTDTIDKLNMTYIANGTQIAIATIAELAGLNSTDCVAPTPHDIFPVPGTYGRENTTISVVLKDPSGIDLANLKMLVNGSEISPSISSVPLGFSLSYTTPVDFIDGDIITIRIIANDTIGNMLDYNWTFIVDGIYPSLPADININLVRIEMAKQGLALDIGTSGEYDDLHTSGPSVIFQDDEYKMWYSGYDGANWQILYANSSDAMNWVKHGLVLSIGSIGDPDDKHALYPSVIFHDDEYKMWYDGYDGSNYRILYANSTDGITWVKHGISIDLGSPGDNDDISVYRASVMYDDDEYKMWYSGKGHVWTILYANSTDGINWNKLDSPVLSNSIDGEYDTMTVYLPSVVRTQDGEYKMWYVGCSDDLVYRNLYANSTNGINWTKQGLAIDRGSGIDPDKTYSSASCALEKDGVLHIWYDGFDGTTWRILYSNLTGNESMPDLSIAWPPSTSNDVQYYDLIRADNLGDLESAESYIMLSSNAYVDTGIGEGNSSNYYYTLRVVDRVGHVSQHTVVLGKIGLNATVGWNLISSPFLEGETPLDTALSSLSWQAAYYYDPAAEADHHWRSNFSSRPAQFNDLDSMNSTMAVWVNTPEGHFVTIGEVRNITIQLHSGWNFVSYPYHEAKQVQDALFGLPYDMVDGFDDAAPYRLTSLTATDIMEPGFGYWIRCTSAAEWNVEQP